MVITRLIGGMGNQLFQYAFARNLSILSNKELLFDLSAFCNYKLHKYALNNFKINAKIASKDQIPRHYNKGGFNRKISKIIDFVYPKAFEINEKKVSFDEKILIKYKGNIYLNGYWQSEKYFELNENIIREELAFINEIDIDNLQIANNIETTNSVSIHIRRKDYLTNPLVKNVLVPCTLEYYYNAIEFINSKVNSPFYFVFSDDINWAVENLKTLKNCIFIRNNEQKNYIDLKLMSLCKHNIIANSSFSWWGAWLNINPSKLIIAPSKWFRFADPIVTEISYRRNGLEFEV